MESSKNKKQAWRKNDSVWRKRERSWRKKFLGSGEKDLGAQRIWRKKGEHGKRGMVKMGGVWRKDKCCSANLLLSLIMVCMHGSQQGPLADIGCKPSSLQAAHGSRRWRKGQAALGRAS
jgi:hypothetical protein